MSNLKLYVPAALQLLLFTCPALHVGHCLPVQPGPNGPLTSSCVSHAKLLLWNITETLAQNKLFRGFSCEEQSPELNTETEMMGVCTPKEATCSGVETEFDRDSCMMNIGKDLIYHSKALEAHLKQSLSPGVLLCLQELIENCFPWSLSTHLKIKEATLNHPNTFEERLYLCKVLKGFHIRAITINRAVEYIQSEEQKKK